MKIGSVTNEDNVTIDDIAFAAKQAIVDKTKKAKVDYCRVENVFKEKKSNIGQVMLKKVSYLMYHPDKK